MDLTNLVSLIGNYPAIVKRTPEQIASWCNARVMPVPGLSQDAAQRHSEQHLMATALFAELLTASKEPLLEDRSNQSRITAAQNISTAFNALIDTRTRSK